MNSAEALPGLVALLSDSAHPAVRRAAASLLGYFGPDARGAINPLTQSLRDPDADVRAAAAETLGKMGIATPELLSALEQLAQAADPRIRLMAIAVMVNVAPADSRAASLLLRHLDDSTAALRVAAINALSSLKGLVLPALDRLLLSLNDPEPAVRAAAVGAIGEIGPSASAARGRLSELAQHDSSRLVRVQAADALASVDGHPRAPTALKEPSKLNKCMSPTARNDRRC
ncbi:MAG: HEAT repeat domain-containing protein [Gemmatimonadaceae bacterium]